ncbi:MAG TPA: GNAT family N-acetyltransferase [Myxococcaceae bacterium]|nr:GNAT family N-acetyltransferase [Myxococcaceae bacterium]
MIRRACVEDVPVIGQLIRDLAEYERLSHEVTFEEAELQRHLFGPNPRAEALIAEEDGAAVGFALYFYNFSTFLGRPGIYLEDLFVRPAHRHHGHGRAMLRELARIAVERGCGRFEWAVLDWNKPAIDFYRSLGAVAMHDWRIFRVTGDPLLKLAGAPGNSGQGAKER